MTAFNTDPAADIHVERDDDGVKIRFGGDTLGINTGNGGLSISNDWNNRHFTLGFEENSILYHLTREDIDDRKSGKGNLPPEEFIAEIYGYVRSLGNLIPEDQIGLDIVGEPNIDETKRYLEEQGVFSDTKDGLQFDGEKKARLERRLEEEPAALGKAYERILDPVPLDEVKKADSGENIYFYPTEDEIFALFTFPDNYIGITTLDNLLGFATYAGGSQIMDHIIRSLSE